MTSKILPWQLAADRTSRCWLHVSGYFLNINPKALRVSGMRAYEPGLQVQRYSRNRYFPQTGGPRYRPKNATVLFIGTPDKAPLILEPLNLVNLA